RHAEHDHPGQRGEQQGEPGAGLDLGAVGREVAFAGHGGERQQSDGHEHADRSDRGRALADVLGGRSEQPHWPSSSSSLVSCDGWSGSGGGSSCLGGGGSLASCSRSLASRPRSSAGSYSRSPRDASTPSPTKRAAISVYASGTTEKLSHLGMSMPSWSPPRWSESTHCDFIDPTHW